MVYIDYLTNICISVREKKRRRKNMTSLNSDIQPGDSNNIGNRCVISTTIISMNIRIEHDKK